MQDDKDYSKTIFVARTGWWIRHDLRSKIEDLDEKGRIVKSITKEYNRYKELQIDLKKYQRKKQCNTIFAR